MFDLERENLNIMLIECPFASHIMIGSLHSILHNTKIRLNHDHIIKVATAVAQAMNYLHSQKPPILHKDIKSENVLIGKNWQLIKVTDFGLSFFTQQNSETEVCGSKYVGSVQWR